MKIKNKEMQKAFLLLFLSFTFANSVTVAIHELGHAIAIRAGGISDVRIILHPYISSMVIWKPVPELLGFVDAAGPLFNILVSTIIFAIFWKFRKPAFMPLLIMAPISYFQEGFSSFMQIVLNQTGTDSIRIVESGIPKPIVLIIAVIFLLLGIFLFVSLLPMFGIRKSFSFGRIFMIIFGATGLNMVIIFIFGLWYGIEERFRALILFTGMLLFSLVFTALYKTLFKNRDFLKIRLSDVRNSDILTALILAAVPVTLLIVFFN